MPLARSSMASTHRKPLPKVALKESITSILDWGYAARSSSATMQIVL